MMSVKKNVGRGAAVFTLFGVAAFLSACAQVAVPVVDTTPAFYRNLESPASQLDLQDAARTISTYRVSKGLNPVVIDPSLVVIAQNHAAAQARANKVGHAIGGSFESRIRDVESQRGASVENVSAGYRSFAEAFSGWRDSKGHNANLLNAKVTRLGIAKAINPGSKFKVFWTLIMTSEPL